MPLETEFSGTARFEIRRRLGAGAYGVVYEAFDREREGVVALKTLRPGNVEALYRLKSEFRALSDIVHPNLVTLYELLTDSDQWFFTMELIAGANFLRHVRDGGPPSVVFAASLGSTTSEPIAGAAAGTSTVASFAAGRSFDEERLRRALGQVVCGVSALHDAGKLHRDIKPSNVLVTREGRVVLLDFGLVAEFDPPGSEDRSLSMVGTPAYMAPELGSRTPVSQASDWYSLGVMLYEALTTRLPFNGTLADMMWQKNSEEPSPPRLLVSNLPDDLDSLCMDLLRRDPRARPGGRDILRRLGTAAAEAAPSVARSLSLRPGPFVGRNRELSALREAFEATRTGQSVTVYVHGTSGIGKSALVRRFLEDVREESAVVLAGRCYERESMPYKALDSLVDGLSRYLKKLPAEQAEGLLPVDVLALARVFPVLRRVEAVAATRRKPVEIADSVELRRRAFAALRELFARLVRKREVVLFIDDLQWGDADSAALLEELMRPPEPPALLVIACYRSEEAETSPLLKRLLTLLDSSDVRHLAVEELAPLEALELALALPGAEASISPAQAALIARESAGNPFFINELARFGRPGQAATVDEMVRARVRLLPPDARRLLEIVAVAGRPLEAEIAAAAAGAPEGVDALPSLRAGHLVRARGAAEHPEIETYHDRIREAVLAQIPAETLREHHRRLAVSLEASGRADPEELSLHFQEGGDSERAAQHAVAAGDRAAAALAFDRAARFYRLALELETAEVSSIRGRLHQKLGEALVNAGRGAEAAKAFLAAAEGAGRAEALVLEQRAAKHLIQSGHLDEALPIFERMTGRVGLTLIQPSWRTFLQLVLGQAVVRLRGLRFRERDSSEVAPEQLIRMDTYWALAAGLSLVNTAQFREFQTRHLLIALRAGEPHRVARAIAFECGYSGTRGWRGRGRSEALFRRAMSLAERLQDPYAMGLSLTYACAGAFFQSQWKESWDLGQRAEALLRERCTGVAWEINIARVASMRSLFYLGGLKELSEKLPTLIREARDRADNIAEVSFRTRHAYLGHLAADEPETAAQDLQEMMGIWSREGFQNPHHYAMISGGDIALFRGDGAGAWKALAQQWPRFKRSGLIHLEVYRLEARYLRARAALAMEAASISASERSSLRRAAARDTRRIERERTPFAGALARLVRAGIASAEGDLDRARRLLEIAEKELGALDMALHAAGARRRRGQLLGGDEGAALVAEADAWMAAQDIRNPARMADMLAPGRWS